MPDRAADAEEFNTQYASLIKEVFREIVRDALAGGSDAAAEAQRYADRGKPDFALAYLVESTLSDDEKRELLARSYENRADFTEARAREWDRTYHREFSQLFTAAAKDRTAARQVRTGRPIRPSAGKQLPVL